MFNMNPRMDHRNQAKTSTWTRNVYKEHRHPHHVSVLKMITNHNKLSINPKPLYFKK